MLWLTEEEKQNSHGVKGYTFDFTKEGFHITEHWEHYDDSYVNGVRVFIPQRIWVEVLTWAKLKQF